MRRAGQLLLALVKSANWLVSRAPAEQSAGVFVRAVESDLVLVLVLDSNRLSRDEDEDEEEKTRARKRRRTRNRVEVMIDWL